jgi:hypothetical protein
VVDDKRALSSVREVILWMLLEVSGMGELLPKSFCERVSRCYGDVDGLGMNNVKKMPDIHIETGNMSR